MLEKIRTRCACISVYVQSMILFNILGVFKVDQTQLLLGLVTGFLSLSFALIQLDKNEIQHKPKRSIRSLATSGNRKRKKII